MIRGSFRDRATDGFIIVAVLWILAALAALVSVYTVFVINTAVGSKLGRDRVQAESMIEAALELTAYRLTSGFEKTPPTSGAFEFQTGRSRVSVAFRSEGARIDLNAVKKPLLVSFLNVLGADSDRAEYFADRIIGWRRKTKAGGRNEEVEAYQRAGLRYLPRQAPFQNAAELRLVLDLPAALVDRMLPYVTVFNGRAEIDAMVADPTVLAALPDISRNLVAEIVETRKTGDTRAVLDLLGRARTSVATDARKATRVNVHIGFDSGRQVNANVVILLMEDGYDPYRVLAWQDDFDGPSP